MPSREFRHRVVNRTVFIVFVIELAMWGVWSQLFMRAPFASPLIRPVMEVSSDLGQFVFGCRSLACVPYVFVGVVIYFYVTAIIIVNLYDWASNRLLVEPA